MKVKVLKVSNEVDEIQVYADSGEFIGAGAWSKPYDKDVAVRHIIDVTLSM